MDYKAVKWFSLGVFVTLLVYDPSTILGIVVCLVAGVLYILCAAKLRFRHLKGKKRDQN